MQAIYGEREHRAAQRAVRVEAVREVLADLAMMAFAIGLMLVAGVFGGGK